MSFLLARIEHAARAFLRGGDLNSRTTRAAAERKAFDDQFPDGPYIPGFDYTPGPGVMQDMGANCAAAAEMFPQYTKARSVVSTGFPTAGQATHAPKQAGVAPRHPVAGATSAPATGPREPRVVQVLGESERDAVWKCEELAPTPLWDPLYAWNSRGFWTYYRHGAWNISSAGAGDVSAASISPGSDLVVQFTEVINQSALPQ